MVSELLKMSNITEQEIVKGFIQYVFEELQTEGWKTRRDDMIANCDFRSVTDFEFDFPDDLTISKMLNSGDDLDEVIMSFLFPILTNQDWMKAWLIRYQPDLDEERHWSMWDALYTFMYNWQVTTRIDDVKEILGLDLCFK